MMDYTPEQLISIWEAYLEKNHKGEIINADKSTKSIKINFWDIDNFDSGFADYLLNKPTNSIYAAGQAILNLLPGDLIEHGIKLKPRIFNIDTEQKIKINELRAEHLGKFVAIEGIIRRTTEVRPDLRTGIFHCLRCRGDIKVEQESTTMKEPLECSKEQGGCGRAASSTAFKLLTDKSTFENTQKIEILETPEGLGRRQPESLNIFLENDIAGKLLPADRVIINGIVRSAQRISRTRGKSTTFDILLEGNSIEMKERGYEEIKVSKPDEKRIRGLAKNENIYNILVEAFAPTIYGLNIEKLTLIFQLFGGVTKIMPGGMKMRGDSHVFLVGDPSTAKSQLILASDRLAPISQYVAGKNASGPGLGAGAVKDTEFGGGRWVLEPGAAVLADQGHLGIDEIDKMSKSAQDVLHEIMEQQEIHVAKVTKGNLKTRCSILAGANPKYGRFDESKPIVDQIKMDPALLTRFDVIFPIMDIVEKDKDTKMAEYILKAHQAGEVAKNIDELGNEFHSMEEQAEKMKPFMKSITTEFMRKYIAYSRQFCFPVMSDKSLQELNEYFIKLRLRGEAAGTIAITPRQLEGLIRLAEASARVRLSNTVASEDVERVVYICDYFLGKVASEGGILDIDTIMTGTPKSKRAKIILVEETIREQDQGPGVFKDIIYEELEKENLSRSEVEELLLKSKKEGRLFNPKLDVWKVV